MLSHSLALHWRHGLIYNLQSIGPYTISSAAELLDQWGHTEVLQEPICVTIGKFCEIASEMKEPLIGMACMFCQKTNYWVFIDVLKDTSCTQCEAFVLCFWLTLLSRDQSFCIADIVVSDLDKALVCAEFGSSRDPAILDAKFRCMRNVLNRAQG